MARTRRHPVTAAVLYNGKARRYYRSSQSAVAAASTFQFYLAIAIGVVLSYFYFASIQM